MRIDVEQLANRLRVDCIRVAGVDIGAEGGFCINGNEGIQFFDMPEDSKTEWYIINQGVSRIWAEDVHAFHGQGVVSVASLMKRKGRLEGFAYALGKNVNWLEPLKWIECFTLKRKKHFDNKLQWKKHLIEVGQLLYPPVASQLTLRTADAFLIWVYAAHKELDILLTKL